MKRILTSIFLLILVFSTAIYSTIKVDTITSNMLLYIEKAQKENSVEDYSTLPKTIETMNNYYKKNQNTLYAFVRRDYINSPQNSFCTITAYSEKDYKGDLDAELERAKTQIYQLRNLFFDLL